MNTCRISITLGAAAAGLLAAAFLPTAIAAADDYVYLPDFGSFQEKTNPIDLSPLIEQYTGLENFYDHDLTTGADTPDSGFGDTTITEFLGNSVDEIQFKVGDDYFPTVPGAPAIGTEITLWETPWLSLGNELIVSSSVPSGFEDIAITPFGDFPL